MHGDSDLKSKDFSPPVVGIIFLKFADIKYSKYEKEIKEEYEKNKGTRLEEPIGKIAIEKCGLYLPDTARYDYLKDLPEGFRAGQRNSPSRVVNQLFSNCPFHSSYGKMVGQMLGYAVL